MSRGKTMKDSHRQVGVITYVEETDYRGEGGVADTVNIGMEFVAGGCQSFGGLYLPDSVHREIFKAQVMSAFGVSNFTALVGRHGYALRQFSGWNEPIYGLESEITGRKVTLTSIRQALGVVPEASGLEARRQTLHRSIEYFKRRVLETQNELLQIEADYVDWDK